MTTPNKLGNIALCQQIAMLLETGKIDGELDDAQTGRLVDLRSELDIRIIIVCKAWSSRKPG